jgi:catechol 2,3-dioxygenase-like lactoylglutathione lyase family enzyme
MQLVTGINHVAVMTDDLDRFVEFYTGVFELEILFEETTPAFRHAILRAGTDCWIHPAEVVDGAHGTALPNMFDRGHVDHLALTAATPAAFATTRGRLMQRGACDGAIDDLGAFHSLWFVDPDGMRVEFTLVVDPELREFHAPRALTEPAQ